MNAPELLDVLDKLGQPNVLVVGDLILDLYTWGDAERISQEAPVILLRADRREKRLGGAANVCQMLRGLEANVMCAGIVGRDEAGQWVIDRLVKEGVECRQRPKSDLSAAPKADILTKFCGSITKFVAQWRMI